MIVEPLEPIGAVVRDVDLGDPVDDVDHDRLRDALADHGVLMIPDQHLDDDGFARFLSGFGPLQFTTGETPVPGRDDLNVVTNEGRDTPPVSNWHVDTAYVASPPAYTALRAVEVPDAGGETLFTNQYRAWETLDDATRGVVEGRTLTHVVTGVDPGDGAEVAADHPLVRAHPRSGRRALLLDAPARCAHVSGLDDAGAADLVAALLAWSTRPDNVVRHRWRSGDVVIWDNAAVLHRGDHSGVVGTRTFHRGMVAAAGHRPTPPPARSRDGSDP